MGRALYKLHQFQFGYPNGKAWDELTENEQEDWDILAKNYKDILDLKTIENK